jgi:hypothetical protein
MKKIKIVIKTQQKPKDEPILGWPLDQLSKKIFGF